MEGGAEEISTGEGPTQIYDGARLLFEGGVCFNGWKGAVGCFAILGG